LPSFLGEWGGAGYCKKMVIELQVDLLIYKDYNKNIRVTIWQSGDIGCPENLSPDGT
jgi:hypothetical protein